MADTLVVKLTAGAGDNPELVNQAFTVTATAAAAGARVSLWLTGNAVTLALPGAVEAVELPQAPPLADLRDLIVEVGTMTVCSQCAARRDLSASDLLPQVRLAGSVTFVEEILAPGVQALVY